MAKIRLTENSLRNIIREAIDEVMNGSEDEKEMMRLKRKQFLSNYLDKCSESDFLNLSIITGKDAGTEEEFDDPSVIEFDDISINTDPNSDHKWDDAEVFFEHIDKICQRVKSKDRSMKWYYGDIETDTHDYPSYLVFDANGLYMECSGVYHQIEDESIEKAFYKLQEEFYEECDRIRRDIRAVRRRGYRYDDF